MNYIYVDGQRSWARATHKQNTTIGEKSMKTTAVKACTAALACLLAGTAALGQVSEEGMGKVLPVHLYACSYLEGKGPGDLEKVIAGWTKYADDNGLEDYAAWTLTPYHFGPEQDFDVIWLGAYSDGHAMGKGVDNWLATGQQQRAAFDRVVDCDAHLALASAVYKMPEGGTPDSGLLTMMDCKLNEGQEYEAIKAAELTWAAHLEDAGSKAGYWHWFPMYGGGDADYDYKVVFAYPDFASLGADFERFANGGGREMSDETFGDIDECDDARVYVITNRRMAKLRE